MPVLVMQDQRCRVTTILESKDQMIFISDLNKKVAYRLSIAIKELRIEFIIKDLHLHLESELYTCH